MVKTSRPSPRTSSDNNPKVVPDTKHQDARVTSTAPSQSVANLPSDRQQAQTAGSKFGRNKTRVLVLTTRGITSRFRHLQDDILTLLPHAKKEPKLDSKDRLDVANEIADLRNCSNILLFEARKRADLYLWLANAPFGPTFKFLVSNVHTMDELAFPGNNLKYSRPLLTFDHQFDASPCMKLMREMLTQVFAPPNGHRRTKPFVDHVIAFYVCDNRIWLRHYQIVDAALNDKTQNKDVESTLVEIGPRLVLTPIKCFSSSFAGATIWESNNYISPNEIRRAIRKRTAAKVQGKQTQKLKRRRHIEKNHLEPDPLAHVFRS